MYLSYLKYFLYNMNGKQTNNAIRWLKIFVHNLFYINYTSDTVGVSTKNKNKKIVQKTNDNFISILFLKRNCIKCKNYVAIFNATNDDCSKTTSFRVTRTSRKRTRLSVRRATFCE